MDLFAPRHALILILLAGIIIGIIVSARQAAAPLAAPAAPNGQVLTMQRNLSRIVAALLALFLGGFGVHRFYLGRVGSGLLYLLFCWTFIPAIVAFIEALFLFGMSDQRLQLRYCYS